MDAFIGEIRALPYNYAPVDWLPCNGQTVSLQQYQALYAIIGTLYGPATSTTFTLPNLNTASVLMGTGSNPALSPNPVVNGQKGGTATPPPFTLPSHSHPFYVMDLAGTDTNPSATVIDSGNAKISGVTPTLRRFAQPTGAATPMSTGIVGPAGTPTPVPFATNTNYQPSLAIQFCICTYGNFPARP